MLSEQCIVVRRFASLDPSILMRDLVVRYRARSISCMLCENDARGDFLPSLQPLIQKLIMGNPIVNQIMSSVIKPTKSTALHFLLGSVFFYFWRRQCQRTAKPSPSFSSHPPRQSVPRGRPVDDRRFKAEIPPSIVRLMRVELFSVRRKSEIRRGKWLTRDRETERGRGGNTLGSTDGHDITMRVTTTMMMPRHVMKTPAGMNSAPEGPITPETPFKFRIKT